MRYKQLIWTGLLTLSLFGAGATQAKAADNGELIQGVRDGKVYYVEGNLKRWIEDRATFDAWGFNPNAIRQVSMAELNAQPTGPSLTRLINYAGNIYYVDGGQRRWVPSFDVLLFYNISPNKIQLLNFDTFNRLSDGGTLTAPFAFRLSNNQVFVIENGQRRPIPNDDVLNAWGLIRNNLPINDNLRNLPVGPNMTKVVNDVDTGMVFWIDKGERHYIPTESSLLYNNLSWSMLSNVTDQTASQLHWGGNLVPPALIATASDPRVWMPDDDGTRHYVPGVNMLYDYGLNLSSITWVSRDVAFKYPEAGALTRFIQDKSNIYFFVLGGVRHEFNGKDAVQKQILGVSDSDLRQVGWSVIYLIAKGSYIQSGMDNFQGHVIPATTGKVGREQHLYVSTAEMNLGRTDASAALHYANTGTPSAAQNGMAGGYGAFAGPNSFPSVEQERYYINMRWDYCAWDDTRGCINGIDLTSKNWHRHKKVVVTNPANGKQLVASVEDFGPAIWTGRVSGLSPEAMNVLDAKTDDTLSYLWSINQSIGLGPL